MVLLQWKDLLANKDWMQRIRKLELIHNRIQYARVINFLFPDFCAKGKLAHIETSWTKIKSGNWTKLRRICWENPISNFKSDVEMWIYLTVIDRLWFLEDKNRVLLSSNKFQVLTPYTLQKFSFFNFSYKYKKKSEFLKSGHLSFFLLFKEPNYNTFSRKIRLSHWKDIHLKKAVAMGSNHLSYRKHLMPLFIILLIRQIQKSIEFCFAIDYYLLNRTSTSNQFSACGKNHYYFSDKKMHENVIDFIRFSD